MKAIILLGLIFILIGYMKQTQKLIPPKIEYRYIPRTFEEEQENPAKISQIFSDMFQQTTPWIAGRRQGIYKPQRHQLNIHHISQW